jgi:hypothetical protein
MTFKPLVLREAARQADNGRSDPRWVDVRGFRSSEIHQREAVAGGTRPLRDLQDHIDHLRNAHG